MVVLQKSGRNIKFYTILIFDKNYKFLDVAYQQLTSSGSMNASYTVKEAGYAFMYVSNEQAYQTDVYIDDVTMSYTPSSILQSNEYYPFGLQTANSWTRDNTTNKFLYDAGSELNSTTVMYDLPYRNYDAALGRFFQVDALAHKSSDFTPYHYAVNNPIIANDPSGLDKMYWDESWGPAPWVMPSGGGGASGAIDEAVSIGEQWIQDSEQRMNEYIANANSDGVTLTGAAAQQLIASLQGGGGAEINVQNGQVSYVNYTNGVGSTGTWNSITGYISAKQQMAGLNASINDGDYAAKQVDPTDEMYRKSFNNIYQSMFDATDWSKAKPDDWYVNITQLNLAFKFTNPDADEAELWLMDEFGKGDPMRPVSYDVYITDPNGNRVGSSLLGEVAPGPNSLLPTYENLGGKPGMGNPLTYSLPSGNTINITISFQPVIFH